MQSGAGMGMLMGLAENRSPTTVLPLLHFESDTMSVSDLYTVFQDTHMLFWNLRGLLLPEVRGTEWDNNVRAVAAIAASCTSLEDLQYGKGIPAAGLQAVATHCRQLCCLRLLSQANEDAGLAGEWHLTLLSIYDASNPQLPARIAKHSRSLRRLSLGSEVVPLVLTSSLVRCIKGLRELRWLSLTCIRQDNTDASIVSELGNCATLKSLSITGPSLPAGLVTGPACSALDSLSLERVFVDDTVLALLPAHSIRSFTLVKSSGYTISGVGSLLRGARHLCELTLREEAAHHLGTDEMANEVASSAMQMPELFKLFVELPDLTDAGAGALFPLCSQLLKVHVRSPLLSEGGARALLRAASGAAVIDIALCSSIDPGLLDDMGPRVERIVLPAMHKYSIQGANAIEHPSTRFVYL